MKICAKKSCNNVVPSKFTDDEGKFHNCQKRKFCFTCSPFGQHNTKDLNNYEDRGKCIKCGKPTQKGYKKSKCHSCYFEEKKERRTRKIYDIVGYKCWYCDYGKGFETTSILDFHHMDPNKKLFGISTRNAVGQKWDRIYEEMKKCVVLCCRCHREYHAGLINHRDIEDIYLNKWQKMSTLS